MRRGESVKIGDWVKVRLATNWIFGYVDQLSSTGTVFVRKIYAIDGEGKKRFYNPEYNYGSYEMERVVALGNELDETDLDDLINIALDTQDRDWFLELTKKRGEQVEKVY